MKYRVWGGRSLWALAFLVVLFGPAAGWAQYEAPESDSGITITEPHFHLDMDGLVRPWIGYSYVDQRINWSLDSLNILRHQIQDEWKTSFSGSSKSVFLYRVQAGDTTGIPVAFDYDTYRLIRNRENTLAQWRASVETQLRLRDREKARDLVAIALPFKLPKAVQSIVGEGGAGLKVNGSKRISFSGSSQWRDGPQTSLAQSQSKFPSLDMEQVTQMTITGKIGSKIEVKVDQDSRRVTDLGNRIQIRYRGDEDEIIQTIEAGNTNLALPRTQFVGYSQRVQGLFGVKSTAKIGHLDLTAIVSQEKGSTEGATFTAGARGQQRYIRDDQYLRYKYFWILNPFKDARYADYRRSGATITKFVLYRTAREEYKAGSPQALCLPNIPDTLTIDKVRQSTVANFDPYQEIVQMEEVDAADYLLREDEFWLTIFDNTPISESDILGYYMEITVGGRVDTIGERVAPENSRTDSVSLLLQMLKPRVPQPSHPTWDLEWKNVYDLGVRDITDTKGLAVNILRGKRGTEAREGENLDRQDTTAYLQIFGLDQTDEAGTGPPDLILDMGNPNILLRSRGHLIFPNQFPFAPTSYPAANSDSILNVLGDRPTYAADGTKLSPEVPGIYAGSTGKNRQEASEYYLTVSTTERQTSYSLGRINIIEGSETVKLNGRQLQRGVDYNISYELGQINFINDDVLDPNANVTVDYEYEPFLSTARKTLFGMRGEYSLGRDFKWGATALFKAEKQPDDQKPRLGEEPSRTFIWDTDLGFRKDVPILTKLTDALPLIEATSPSNIDVQAEVAQSRPNPNTKGEVFVDDFEASQEITSLPLLREYWTKSSPPADASIRGDDVQDPLTTRGKLIWYNRYDPYRATEIYDKEEQAAEDRKQVLTFKFVPHAGDTMSWGGVMRYLSSGIQNLSNTQYMEFRIQGGEGKLVLNLGQISEDIDRDKHLDTEDRIKPGVSIQNGILDEGEDVGLDTLPDALEPACDPADPYCDPSDPSGDNWAYTQEDKNNYWRINGTEGNKDDPLRGWLPDTEDLNGNASLDQNNNYFEYVIDLSDPLDPYLVQNSGFCGECSEPQLGDWRTYRIPINDTLLRPIQVGIPNLQTVEYMRLYVTDVPQNDTVQINIADMNLVSYRWRDTRVEVDSAAGQDFRVAVVNTRENQDYISPPGVEEVIDRVTLIGQGEQSLLLRYSNLQPSRTVIRPDTVFEECADTVCPVDTVVIDTLDLIDRGLVSQTLLASQDYTGYRKLQMFVHGDANADGTLEFVLRFGSDTVSYYEYHTRVYPGWDERNHIDVDFNELTGLKFEVQKDKTLAEQREVDTTGGPGNRYRIKGNPSLSRIEYLEMGVANHDSLQVRSGEIWVDELRLTDVRKDVGWAARLSVNTNFSDFASVSVAYRNQNYAFQTLTAARNNVVNSSSSKDYSVNVRLSPHKILPPSWGLQLPVNFNWGRSTTTPYLKTRSDIVVPEESRAEEATISKRKGATIAERITSKSNNPLVKYLLAPFSASLSYSESETSSPTLYRSLSKGYTSQGRYSLAFQKPFSIPIFFWTKYILLPQKLANTRLTLFPSTFQAQGNFSQRRSESQYIEGGAVTGSYARDFKGQFSLKYSPLPGLNADYTYNTLRDLRDRDAVNLVPLPSKFKLGVETMFSQAFRTSYSTRIIPFLEQRYNFDATYQENLERQTDGTRSITMNRSLQGNYSLSWQRLFGKPNDSDRWFTPYLYQPIRKLVRGVLNRIDPLSFNYTFGQQIRGFGYPLDQRPSKKFRFGLTDTTEARKTTVTGIGQRDGKATSNSYSARSGVNLLGARVTFVYSVRDQQTDNVSSVTRSYSRTFPSVRFAYTDLTKIGLIKHLANSASLESSYDEKRDYQENVRDNTRTSEGTDKRFNPLLQITMNFRGNMSSAFKVNHGERITAQPSSVTQLRSRSTEDGVQMSFSYSFSAPSGIRLPFLSGIKLRSTLNLNTAVSWSKTRSDQSVNNQPWELKNEQTSFSVAPTAGYSFSQNLTGGFKARWQDTNNKTQQSKTHVRELGFWVEFRF